ITRYRPQTIVTAMPANTTQRAAKNSRKSISSTPINTGRYNPAPSAMAHHRSASITLRLKPRIIPVSCSTPGAHWFPHGDSSRAGKGCQCADFEQNLSMPFDLTDDEIHGLIAYV